MTWCAILFPRWDMKKSLPGKEALEDCLESLSVFLKALLIYHHNLQKKPDGEKKNQEHQWSLNSIRNHTSVESKVTTWASSYQVNHFQSLENTLIKTTWK